MNLGVYLLFIPFFKGRLKRQISDEKGWKDVFTTDTREHHSQTTYVQIVLGQPYLKEVLGMDGWGQGHREKLESRKEETKGGNGERAKSK